MSELMGIMLSKTREENDYASGDRLLQNQGKIDALKYLINAIENGINKTS